jgi:transcriptional regulator with GAF, ATPase, and Fis domain
METNTQIQGASIGLDNDNHLKIEAELVLDCLDQDILILSKDLRIIFANAMFLQKIGLSKEAVIGKFCYEVTHNRTSKCEPPNDPCPISKLDATSQPAIEVHTHSDKDKKEFFVNVVAASIMQDDTCIGYLHLAMPVKNKNLQQSDIETALRRAQDILNVIELYQKQMTEIKRNSNEIQKTKGELEKKIEELEKFNNLTVGRELKMIELKRRIEELEATHAS